MHFDLYRRLSLIFRLGFALLLMGWAWGSLAAQERANSQNPQIEQKQNTPPVSSDSAHLLFAEPQSGPTPFIKPKLGDGLYLLDKDGEPRFVPASEKVTVEEFLRWTEKQLQPAGPPAYTFSDVSLEGKAGEASAELTAKLSIQITKPEEWVSVPLELQEATLLSFRHEYNPSAPEPKPKVGQGKAGFDHYDRRGGLHWWFQGHGQHVLTLRILVPIKKASGIHRLQLPVPSAACSYARLTVPIANEQLSLETIVAGAHQTTAAGKSSSVVELFRLGQRLDLGWRALPDSRQIKTLLKAESKLRVEPTEESILLKAQQFIEPLQGSMKEIEVSLPGGFSVLELKVDGERHRPLEGFPDSPKPLKISLPAATTNRVRLDWILQAPWPTSGQLVVAGFNVSECLRQSGEIGVAGFEGYRIVKRSATDVDRANISDLLGPGPILSAYQFRQQPYQLILEFQRIQPTYSVRPHLFLNIGAKQVELLADLELEVYRGVLESLEIDWPGFEEQGWTIDRTQLPGEVEDVVLDPKSGRISLPFAKRLGQGSEFQFLVRATRKLESSATNAFPLTLPRVIASNPVRTVVVVTNQESVESSVLPAEGTETQPLSAAFAEEVESRLSQASMRDFRGPRQTGFLMRSEQQSFQVKSITHPQAITSETQLRISLLDDRIDVRQSLRYNVKYERISQLRVMVPRTFPENVLFRIEGVPLNFEWTGLEVVAGGSRQARLTLPKSMLNQFEITADYQISQFDREKPRLVLPCVRQQPAMPAKSRDAWSSRRIIPPKSRWKIPTGKRSPRNKIKTSGRQRNRARWFL